MKIITLTAEIFVSLIFTNFMNSDRFSENQHQRNFPLEFHLRNLIPTKKCFDTHLRK